MVDTPERLAEFRRKYDFPHEVEVSYCPEFEVIIFRREGRVVIPLIAIVEGGVRIPMSNLLTNFLCHFKSISTNAPLTFRIVGSVDTLNKRLGLNFTEHDINYIYSCQESKTSKFYFKIRHGEVRLILGFPDSDKEMEGDYLIMSGNWYPGRIHYPMSAGKTGG